MEQQQRDSFRSRWGFKLACIGSAVGMGNIWLFPSRMSAYGGATFLIPYVIFVVLIASTGVIGEMAFGRAAAGGPVAAFGAAAQRRIGSRTWGELLGLIPVAGSLAMAIGYSVVVGWILKYAVAAFTGGALENQGVEGFTAYFNTAASAWGNTGWQIAAMAGTMLIVAFGIGAGIERANKVMMPLFFLMFIGMAVYIATLPGAGEGLQARQGLQPPVTQNSPVLQAGADSQAGVSSQAGAGLQAGAILQPGINSQAGAGLQTGAVLQAGEIPAAAATPATVENVPPSADATQADTPALSTP